MKTRFITFAIAVLLAELAGSCKKEDSTVPVTDVMLDRTTLEIKVGNPDVRLTATVNPENATDKTVKWETGNSGIATVDQQGNVHGVSEGEVIISVIANDGGKSSCCAVVVKPAFVSVSGISIDKPSMDVTAGNPVRLTVTVDPDNATDKTVKWKTDDSNVATVDRQGVVHGLAEGQTTVTATTNDGGRTAGCVVTVKAGGPEYVEIGGLKWARKNIGATSETEYGYYFSWGCTMGYVYDSANRKWVRAADGEELAGGFIIDNAPFYDGGAFSKYTGSDSLSVLVAADDAAAAYLGSGWRMPTHQEFLNLLEACRNGDYDVLTNPSGDGFSAAKGIYWCTSYDGVAGCLFVDAAGSKLFFPAAGGGIINDFYSAGTEGHYLSGTLYPDDTEYAYSLYVNSKNAIPQRRYRHPGYSVRPVSDK